MKELWVPLSGAIATQRNIDVIANNVANVNTAGFKKDSTTFKEHLTALDKGHDEIDLPNKEWKPSDFYRSYGAEHSFVKSDATYSDFSQGQLRPTGSPFDLAIQGPGFFEVLTPHGIRFTRAGNLTISKEGKLTTLAGFPILKKLPKIAEDAPPSEVKGPDERLITIPPGRVSISQTGEISSGDQQIAELSIAEFKDVNALTKEGGGFFVNPDEKNITDKTASIVVQGFLEDSNVNAVLEMSNLIKANRNFESIQRVIKTYDNIAGQASSEIAKF